MNKDITCNITHFVSLRRKLMVSILLASSLITLVTTAFQYFFEYKRDIDYLSQTLSHIGNSNTSTLARSLWNLDSLQIKVQIDSISKLRNFVGVTLYEQSGKIYYQNHQDDFKNIEKFSVEFPLTTTQDGISYNLGKLVIWGTMDHINKKLISRLIDFFLSQLIKTLIIIFVMFYFFRIFITKHLDNIVSFLQAVDLNSLTIQRLELKKKGRSIDELDYVKDSINHILERVEKANFGKNDKIERQERELQLQKAASINSARLASLGEMAANIAHEINNPLTILSFSSKKIINHLSEDDLNRDRLIHFGNMISRTVERMSKTITSLKRLSRDTTKESFVSSNIYNMIDRVLDLCKISLNEKGIELTTEFIGFDLTTEIKCQEVKITQIIINLLNNSRYAIKDLKDPWIKIIVIKDDSHLSFSVVDCGTGIEKEVEVRMFEPFFTTKDIGEGTGLGLSISAATAAEHNGRLFLDTTKENTTITLELPVDL